MKPISIGTITVQARGRIVEAIVYDDGSLAIGGTIYVSAIDLHQRGLMSCEDMILVVLAVSAMLDEHHGRTKRPVAVPVPEPAIAWLQPRGRA